MPKIKSTDPKTHKHTNLKLSLECHIKAKSAAPMIGEGFYQFVETAIWERLKKLTDEKKISFEKKPIAY
jgi:hypothetical protein